ncbi:MAG: asparagine synthase (glutamine-hydrolyzing) [Planctomycetes bacterium]|nr:asparagine synthase (glutamine-hydrolyzing) [Planctomycetota bacterium]
MCGIAGYVRIDGEPADQAVLRAMCDVIVHRGPDSEGLEVWGPAALGMRRLAIIDVAGGEQPMRSEDGDRSMVFNGECYNFLAVRQELEALGARFETRSDTECVLRAIERWGDAAIERFCGMFGLAVWSRERARLTLVRDRVGKKPIHYWCDGKVLLFGSEIKSILVGLGRLGLARPEIDPQALVRYMGYGHVPDPRTIFQGIQKLPPGHRLTLEQGRVQVEAWWHLDPRPSFEGSDDEALERLDSLIENAVRLRLISDVPLGAFLSGGIDSSTVVGMMRRVATGSVKTFSIGFEDQEFDELVHARRVAEHLGTEHEEEVVRPDAAEVIDGILRHFDEPFADSSAIPTYYVSRMARRHVTVALSGDGGDELFAGYARYAATESLGAAGLLPGAMRRLLFGGAARCLPAGFFGKAKLWNLSLNETDRYIHHLTCGLSEWHRSLYTPEFAQRVGDTDPSDVYRDWLDQYPELDATSRRAYADTMVYLPSDVMTKVDRMSMMVSLEARAPLLDHSVVEFAASLPTHLKRHDGVGKVLLRRLARTLVPHEVIDRKKQGFAIPISKWFNAQWMSKTDELLASVCQREIFRADTIRRLRDEHRRGRRDHSQFLWSLAVFEMWHRDYVEGRAFSR